MFDWDDIDEAIENDHEHAPYYVDPVWRSDDVSKTNFVKEHETTTFKYVRAVLSTGEVYICSNCERCVRVTSIRQGKSMDFNYCPYCGRPVVESEE